MLTLFPSASGCAKAQPAAPAHNISPNTSPNLTSPWPNIATYSDDNTTINVSVGQEFVIRYDHFASPRINYEPPDYVILLENQFIVKPEFIPPDGTTWFLFKAVAAGSTNVTINETTRFGDLTPIKKIFKINVISPADASAKTSQTPLPWLDKQVFTDENNPVKVVVGQEFVIGYNWQNNMFAGFSSSFNPNDIVLLLGQQAVPSGQPQPVSGTYWFLLQAAKEGSTNFTVRETGHLNEGVVGQKTFRINVASAIAGANYTPPVTPFPILVTPFDKSTTASTNISFFWISNSGTTYDFQLSTDPAFSTTIVNDKNLTGNTYVLTSPLSPDTTYYWRVRARTARTLSSSWATASFTTVPMVTPPPSSNASPSNGNPWPNAEVFTNWNESINVTVGQEFVIPYSQFTSANVNFQPANVIILVSKQFVQNPATVIPDGTTWILFKAVAVGSTKVSVTLTTRFGDPLQTKTIAINVSPAADTPPLATVNPAPPATPNNAPPTDVVPQPVAFVSSSMVGPINPGGPVVEIALNNTSLQMIVSLNATLELLMPVTVTPPGGVPAQTTLSKPYVFTFPSPVLPGLSASAKLILIGGGLTSDYCPLTINGTLQDGRQFSFTQQVKIQ